MRFLLIFQEKRPRFVILHLHVHSITHPNSGDNQTQQESSRQSSRRLLAAALLLRRAILLPSETKHAKNNNAEEMILWYYPDGYDKEKNIVFEYDESHHYYKDGSLKSKDIKRQKEIIKHTNCNFYRYDEKRNRLYEVKLKDGLCEYNDVCIERN